MSHVRTTLLGFYFKYVFNWEVYSDLKTFWFEIMSLVIEYIFQEMWLAHQFKS